MTEPSWARRRAKARKARGMTQQQLADAVGVHYVTMSKIERAKADVSFSVVEKIAEVLKIPVFDLVSSGPFSNEMRFSGWVKVDGEIEPSWTGVTSTLIQLKNPFSSPDYEWFSIHTAEFYPYLHVGDGIRTQKIIEKPFDSYIDRLCIFTEIEDPSSRFLALLGYGRSPDSFTPKRVNGQLIERPGFVVDRVVSMVLPSFAGGGVIHHSLMAKMA